MMDVWDNCLLEIKKSVTEEAFERWFKNTKPIFINENELFKKINKLIINSKLRKQTQKYNRVAPKSLQKWSQNASKKH